MKNAVKVLAIVLTVALVCCSVVLSTAAANEPISELEKPWQYTNSSNETLYAATIDEAVSGAKTGSTVKLLCDQTVTIAESKETPIVSINKKLTIDLGGHAFMISQSHQQYIGVKTTSEVVIQNGTLVGNGNSGIGSGKGYGIIRPTTAGTKITLKNVNTYSSAVVFDGWSGNLTVNIVGGNHYVIYNQAHMQSGGLVEARKNATVNVTDAFIYLANGQSAVSSMMFNNASGTSKYSNFTFTNSTIVTEDGTSSIIKYANEYTTVDFVGCDIYGSITSSHNSDDNAKGIGAIKDGAIVLSGGTRLGGGAGASYSSAVVGKSGESVLDIEEGKSYDVRKPSGSLYFKLSTGSLSDTNFKISEPKPFGVTFNKTYGSISDFKFIYDSAGRTCYTNDFASAINGADSTVTLNKNADISEKISDYAFSKNVTLDLNGNTLKIYEADESSLKVAEGVKVNVVNGNLIKCDENNAVGKYPVFTAVGKNASVKLSGVSVDASVLFYTEYEGASLEIFGGTHGNFNSSDKGGYNAYVALLATTNIKIENATLLAGNLSIFQAIEGASEITLTGTKILGKSESSTFIESMSEGMSVALKDCDIFASLSVNDIYATDYQGSVKLYEGTRFVSASSNKGLVSAEYKKVFKASKVSENISYVDANGNTLYHTCTFEYLVESVSSDASIIYSKDGYISSTDDIKTALSSADENSEILLLKDISITESAKSFVSVNSNNVTLNLDGHTFEVIQEGEACISVNADFKIKNGTIRAAMDSSVGDSLEGMSYPLFVYRNSYSGIDITIENVNTYAGSLFFTWNCDNHSLTVIGGRHHSQNSGTGCDRGWLNVRGDFKFTAKDAVFYIDSDSYIVTALSFKDTNTTTLEATFDFVGCDIISESGSSNAIRYANQNSKFNFTDCDIFASLNPTLATEDMNVGYAPIGEGAITFAGRIRISADGTYISGGVIKLADGCVETNEQDSERVVFETYSFTSETAEFVTGTKVITVTYSVASERVEDTYVTVKWFKEDGATLIREDKVVKGTVLTPPSYTAGTSNGWFVTGYSGWTLRFASSDKVTDFTATKDAAYYPAVSTEITAKLTAAKYNLTLVGKICNNLYLSVPMSGVQIDGVFVGSREIERKNVIVDGVKYYLYVVSEVDAARLNTSTTVTVKYTVRGEALEDTLTLTPISYAQKLLEDSKSSSPVYSASAHAVAADLVRYSNTLCKIVDGKSDATLDSLISTYGGVLSHLVPSNSFAEYRANTSALQGIIESIQLEVSKTEPRWLFNISSGVSVQSITVVLDGYYAQMKDGKNFGTISYATKKNSQSGAYYTEYIPIYNLDRLMTIRVTLASGQVVEGKYSLNAYYNGFSVQSEDEKNDVRDFLKAFRTLGESSLEYKYSGVTNSEKAANDFFKCDHDNVGAFYSNKGRFCPDCATYIFYYSDFGALADGKSDQNFGVSGTNDHEAMYKCHEAANLWKSLGNKAAVMAVGGAHNGSCFYIGQQYNILSAKIKTDVCWSGAYFIVDDRTVDDVSSSGYKTPVFEATADPSDSNISLKSYVQNGLSAGAKNIGFAPGRPMLVLIEDKSRRNNLRNGKNEDDGTPIREMLLIDEYGNISNDTPVEWDYYNVPYCLYPCTPTDSDSNGVCDTCGNKIYQSSISATGYAVDMDPITISGHDKNGNINFVWETVTDNTVSTATYNQCQRTLKITRSNVTAGGFDHVFTEDDTKETPRQAYAGVINVYRCNNILLKDMLVMHHIGHYRDDGASLGSYEFSGDTSTNITLINYKAKNFFTAGGKISYRGLFGTNFIRNFYLKDCVLPSFDSHSGAYNVVLEDSVFEHVNFVGGGDIYMKNVTVYPSSTGKAACILRDDYGSSWHGNIYIDGLRLRYNPEEYTTSYMELVSASYTNWHFGPQTYLPAYIVANDIVIERYDRDKVEYEFKDGTLVENILGTNEIPLTIYKQLNSKLQAHIDYSVQSELNADPKQPTKMISLSNIDGITVTYPDHPYFAEMKVFIDGVEKTDWFKMRSTICCEDFDGDYVCDQCSYEKACSEEHPTSGESTVICPECGKARYARDDESAIEIASMFEIVQAGQKKVLYENSSIADAITMADNNSTIKLLGNTTHTFVETFNVGKNITIDLNGNTLVLITGMKNGAFTVNSSKSLTFHGGTEKTGGTIVCMSSGAASTNRPIAELKEKATLTYTDVTVLSPCLVGSYGGKNATVNINGGSYYATEVTNDSTTAFIGSRCNMTVNASNALFYLNNGSALIGSASDRETSDTKSSTFTFTNCDIVSSSSIISSSSNLISCANAYTKIVFDGCRISGKINNPSTHSSDKGSGTASSGFCVVKGSSNVSSSSTMGTYTEYENRSYSRKSFTYTIKEYDSDYTINSSNESVTYNYVVT